MQKYYAADHGLVAAITGDGLAQIQGVLEDIVAVEGLRREYNVSYCSRSHCVTLLIRMPSRIFMLCDI